MSNRAFTIGLGIAKRASITVAVSAVLMAGLHYAPLKGFSPSDMLFGHEAEVAALPAVPQPAIRFIAIPAREAFPQAPETAPRLAAVPAAKVEPASAKPTHDPLPMTVAVVPTARPAFRTEPRPAVRGAPPVSLGKSVVAELEPARQRTKAPVRIARRDEATPADTGFAPPRRLYAAATPIAAPVPELELIGEAIPEPGEERGFKIADLVPERDAVVRGVTTVGKTVGHGARYAVNGIADTALAIVGR